MPVLVTKDPNNSHFKDSPFVLEAKKSPPKFVHKIVFIPYILKADKLRQGLLMAFLELADNPIRKPLYFSFGNATIDLNSFQRNDILATAKT